jgi:ketosteroid isomerase-like protein
VGPHEETVRRTWPAFARGDYDTVFADWAEDGEWEMMVEGWPDTTLYKGPAHARKFLEKWQADWEDYEIELLEVRERGDVALCIGRQSGRGPDSGVEVEMVFAQVVRYEGELTRRVEIWIDVEAATRRFEEVVREAEATAARERVVRPPQTA